MSKLAVKHFVSFYLLSSLFAGMTWDVVFAPHAQALIFDNGARRSKVSEAPIKIQQASKSVASVFAPSGFIRQDSGDYLVKKFQMNAVPNSPKTDALRMLCETELYARDFRAESLKGSGVLITPDTILAPAHLFDAPNDCKEKKIVFHFTGHEDIIAQENVYRCKKIESIRYDMLPEFRPQDRPYGSSQLDGHMDYAIIKLDREVTDIEPVRINNNTELLKPDHRLYFVSSMRGLPQTVEPTEIKLVTPAVVSTNASTAQGSSGGIYFTEDGIFVGMHISSNPASNQVDNESNCLKWVQENTETFDWDTLVMVKDRNVERPFGALMLPSTVLHKKLFNLQEAYYVKKQLQEQKPVATTTTESPSSTVATDMNIPAAADTTFSSKAQHETDSTSSTESPTESTAAQTSEQAADTLEKAVSHQDPHQEKGVPSTTSPQPSQDTRVLNPQEVKTTPSPIEDQQASVPIPTDGSAVDSIEQMMKQDPEAEVVEQVKMPSQDVHASTKDQTHSHPLATEQNHEEQHAKKEAPSVIHDQVLVLAPPAELQNKPLAPTETKTLTTTRPHGAAKK